MVAEAQKSKSLIKTRSKLEELFGLDLRSLALFRIGIALLLLTDLFIRSGDLVAHYTDAGVLPRSLLTEELWKPGYWSIHAISGQPLVQALIFLIAGGMALALLVGYQTRLAAIASWALVVSLHNRNPALIFAADDVLRALLFWCMFLPLGAYYSIERALNTSPKPLPKRVLSGATLALTLQICFVYWFSAAFKTTSPIWWPQGNAVYYALSFDQYATHFGQFLLKFPPLLTFFTLSTLWLEWIGPLFLFVPFRTTWFRCATILTFISLHIGFGLSLQIGIFPVLSVFCWLVFIPSEVWDSWGKRLYTPERAGLRIYYDSECGFCKKVVHLLRTFLLLPNIPLLMAQEDPTIFADMQTYNSWVVVDWQERRHYKFEAIAYICSLSPVFKFLTPVLRWRPVMSVGTKFYETVASNRRTAGKFTKPLKFRPIEVRSPRPLNLITLLLFAYTFIWNLRSFAPEVFNRRTLNSVDWISRVTRLDQSWSIFAPSPPRDDGWYVIPGQLADGTQVDLLKDGSAVSYEKPTVQTRNAIYHNMQWRTYFINLNRGIGKKLYPYYGEYLCRRWNGRHQGLKQLKNFEIHFINEKTVPRGQTQPVDQKTTWQQSCS
ncbi:MULTISPECIES: DCC1-like thiol-disulfide oxidoreductase family protein [Trichocoleus]|uniref:DCC1-like thiol-disulfide oxidoreductase family protein n=1 Tax=Trichocoleus desertorum GB2-A4 TaxID=2933944 RepID=A0ABV0J1J4_9CYAN|nr:DCC1-like thiol-disulfide oxidoreductase family protein [Trichocoleus sp. FACHB-46]MBD1860261.1 DUF393 domain-containing protein [Trichocoleus sp. FACHB-46]